MTSPSSNQDQTLRQAYAELAKAEKVGDYERCFKACNRILKAAPNDVVALQCKLVTLIQLQKFDEALQFVRKTPTLLKNCIFEKAYCEYRLNRSEESLKTLNDNADSLDFRCRELLAQLLYRTEKFEESFETYVDLLKNSEDDYDDERRANLAAVFALLSTYSPENSLSNSYTVITDTYEQCYNDASRLIALGQYKEAREMLSKAEELCRKTLIEDEVPEEEIEDEICCIKVQRAYCSQMVNDTEEALKVYTDTVKEKPSDPTLIAIASNNIVSIKKDSNLFDARKKMKACQTQQLEQKLNKQQKEVICFNNVLLNLYGNQLEMCRRGVEELRNKYGAFEEALLCEVALLLRQKDSSVAADVLQKYRKEKGDSCSMAVDFALAQTFLNDGKLSQASNFLSSLHELKYKPAILSLSVAINLANEDRDAAMQQMNDALNWYKNKNPDHAQLPLMVEECATLHAKFADQKTATKYLEDLRKLRPNDASVLVRLINTYMKFDPKKAEEISKSMPPLGRLTHDIDVEALETAGWMALGGKYGAKKAARTTEPTPKPVDSDLLAQKKKRKKNRKPKLPKKMDPNVPPDPERWLPKFERSTYKKRKDKRAKDRDIGRGTQGAVSVMGAAELDSSNKPTNSDVTASPKPTPTGGISAPGPRQQRPAAQKPKKKKKVGGKW